MKKMRDLFKLLLRLSVLFFLIYSMFVCKDLILSKLIKRMLTGKIIYSLSGVDINEIDFPSGKKKNIYSFPQERKGYLNYIESFSFSPDGKKIVFAKMDYLGSGYKDKIYIMNKDGTDMKKLLDLGEDTNMFYPCWSPDGKYIAFGFHRSYKHGGIYFFKIDDPYNSLKMITDILPAIHKIAWSPDSKKVAFVSDEHIVKTIDTTWSIDVFVGRIFLVNVDGTDLRPLTKGTRMSWSLDNKRLVYKGTNAFYIINEDGSGKAKISSYNKPPFSFIVGDVSDTAWSPDGKYIAFIKEIWPGLCGIGIYVAPIDNPKRQVMIVKEKESMIGMFWKK